MFVVPFVIQFPLSNLRDQWTKTQWLFGRQVHGLYHTTARLTSPSSKIDHTALSKDCKIHNKIDVWLEMDQIICGCCHTLLMYSRGALSVRCLCCRTVNLTNGTPGGASNQYSTVRCGNCQMTLMYPYRAPSVKCAICQYITNVGTTNGSLSSFNRQNGVSTSSSPTASFPLSQSQTVVVENPLSLDRSGKLVSNVVVGVTQEKISSKHN
ncbi:protein LSD1-like isoform X2 [Amaranthus tricolor]|uniref:protein LSD1-like isoform X2 n=1 Tax=Amaranthus tricolor TaxID=29722 RepID=UPI00258E2875|nr:protein LSD1-like isoform X2 [Amaranthus tricolor]